MRYLLRNNSGEKVNIIVASEEFVRNYCQEKGYTFEIFPEPEPVPKPEPYPAKLREESYNSQAIISWDNEMLTVTQAAQLWQYYAAEGNTAKTDELTALIADAKQAIREQYPDEEE